MIDLQCVEGGTIAECVEYAAGEIFSVLGPEHEGLALPQTGVSFSSLLTEIARRVAGRKIVLAFDEFAALPDETALRLARTIRATFSNRVIKPELQRLFFIVVGANDLTRLQSGYTSPLRNVTQTIICLICC
jgi:hypothetical protein